MSPRYAIYFAPALDSALWRFGSGVIGYDAAQARAIDALAIPGLSPERQRTLTEEPRRYGFHATLKAPFHLATGRDEAELLAMASNLAAQQAAFTVAPLRVHLLGRFVALVPAGPEPALDRLARIAVEAFEPFRAPLSAQDVARRRPDTLSARQRSYLERWGYPYVLEEFRFHMTLTGALPEVDRVCVAEALANLHAEQVPAEPLPVDRIALFRQDDREARFRLLRCFRLAAHL